MIRRHFLNTCCVLDVLLLHIIISFNPHKFFFRFISVYFFKTKITTQNIWEECSAQSQLKALCNLQPEHHRQVIRNESFWNGSDRAWRPETSLSCPVSPITVLGMLPSRGRGRPAPVCASGLHPRWQDISVPRCDSDLTLYLNCIWPCIWPHYLTFNVSESAERPCYVSYSLH